MQPEKDQYFIYSEAELSLIRNTFAENDELLYAIRNVLLQFPVSDGQKAILSSQMNEDILNVLKKRLLPTLAGDFPLGQLPSLLTTLTEDLKVLNAKEMEDKFTSKLIEINYLEQRFRVLETGEEQENSLNLNEMSKIDQDYAYANISAYLFLLGYIDPMLGMIKNIAGQKDETPEEQKKRLTRDSSK